MLEDVIKIVTQSMQISENITEEVKSELVGEVLVICVREIMKNHISTYSMGRLIYKVKEEWLVWDSQGWLSEKWWIYGLVKWES